MAAAAISPVSSPAARLAARTGDLVLEGVALAAVFSVVHLHHRPLTALGIIWLTVFGFETATTVRWGATPAKRALGLRVIALDADGPPHAGQAARRRAAVNASFLCIPVIGWIWWFVTIAGDPTHRGQADRAAGTMVVPVRAALPVHTHDLPGYADGARRPRITPLGRVGDLDVRIRARFRRLRDAPLLAWSVGILALAATIPHVTGWVILGSAAVWLVVFVIDETRRVHRTAQTAGHRLAGLVILDRRTGAAPTSGRAFVRALVLAFTVYVPIAWPLLAISLALMRFDPQARGLHDLLARTIVVGDPRLDPETQRHLAMQMRVGQAG